MKRYKACELLPEEKVYLKSEVDAEIARLKAIRKVHVEAIESMGAGLLQDSEEIRKLKRALYKACANWAKVRQRAGYFSWTLWGKMKDKCLNKMEEYK